MFSWSEEGRLDWQQRLRRGNAVFAWLLPMGASRRLIKHAAKA